MFAGYFGDVLVLNNKHQSYNHMRKNDWLCRDVLFEFHHKLHNIKEQLLDGIQIKQLYGKFAFWIDSLK